MLHIKSSCYKRKTKYNIPLNSSIVPSINEGKLDALIYDHPCFHRNTYSLHVYLKLLDNKLEDHSEYLTGLKYSVVMGDICIYQSILTKENIFPITNVPFNLVHNTEILLYIHNINVDPDKYFIQLEHHESSPEHINSCRIVSMPKSKNYLVFNVHTDHGEELNKFPIEYLEKYSVQLSTDTLKYLNINHFYDNFKNKLYNANINSEIFCTPNSNERVISLFRDRKYSFYDMISETFILPMPVKANVYSASIICTCDALTNIEILTKRDVKNISYNSLSVRENFNENFTTQYTKIKNGYKLLCCNDMIHLVTIGDVIVTVNIEFNPTNPIMSSIKNWNNTSSKKFKDAYVVSDTFIKYDRFTYSSSLRDKWMKNIKNEDKKRNYNLCYTIDLI